MKNKGISFKRLIRSFGVIVPGGVFVAEVFNTSIETLSDTLSPEFNKNIKQVKDFAAGSVLVATLTSIIVGLIIFLPKICNKLCT